VQYKYEYSSTVFKKVTTRHRRSFRGRVRYKFHASPFEGSARPTDAKAEAVIVADLVGWVIRISFKRNGYEPIVCIKLYTVAYLTG
jgi:hypothetical protein